MNTNQPTFLEQIATAALPNQGESLSKDTYMQLFGGYFDYSDKSRKIGGKAVMVLQMRENLADEDKTCEMEAMFCLLPTNESDFVGDIAAVTMSFTWVPNEELPYLMVVGKHTLAFDHPFNEYLEKEDGSDAHYHVDEKIPDIHKKFLEYIRDYSTYFFQL